MKLSVNDMMLKQAIEAETDAIYANIQYSMATEAEGEGSAVDAEVADMAETLRELEAELKEAEAAGDGAKVASIMAKIEALTKESAAQAATNPSWKKAALIGAGIAASIAVTAGGAVAVKKWRDSKKAAANKAGADKLDASIGTLFKDIKSSVVGYAKSLKQGASATLKNQKNKRDARKHVAKMDRKRAKDNAADIKKNAAEWDEKQKAAKNAPGEESWELDDAELGEILESWDIEDAFESYGDDDDFDFLD